MDEGERLLEQLPESLATALRLQASGQPESVIATALGIPVEGVSVLLEVAQAKLTELTECGNQ